MKKIANTNDVAFFEDSEGRLHRKGKSSRNTFAFIVFIPLAIGSLICAGNTVFQGDWDFLFVPIIGLLIATFVLWYLWQLSKIPKLIFDTPVKTIILQTSGNEERHHFDGITRFNINFTQSDEFDDYGTYDVTVSFKSNDDIGIAIFYGKKIEALQKAEDFVAYLEKITKSYEPRTDLEAKIPPSA